MQTSRAPFRLVAAGVALTAFLAAGCGVEGADDASPDTTEQNTDATVDQGGSGDATTTTVDTSDTTVDDTSDDLSDDTSDDMSDDVTTTTKDPSDSGAGLPDTLPPEVKEQVVEQFVAMGFTEEQANCVADEAFADGLDDAADYDATKALEWFESCGISLSDLSNIGAGG